MEISFTPFFCFVGQSNLSCIGTKWEGMLWCLKKGNREMVLHLVKKKIVFIIISKYFWSSKVDLVKFFSSFYGCTCKQDISEWEEDADEYIRKNLPSELVWERMIFLNLWITISVAVFTFFFFLVWYTGRNFWMEGRFIYSQKKRY